MREKQFNLCAHLFSITILLILLTAGTQFVQAQTEIKSPLPGDYDTLEKLIARTVGLVSGGIAVVATASMVFAGIRLVFAGSSGNEESIKRGKEAVKWAALGFLVILFTYTLVASTLNFLGASTDSEYAANANRLGNPLVTDQKDALQFLLGNLFIRVMRNTVAVGGGLTVLGILINAIRFMTARGNEENINKSKSGLIWSAVGFGVMLLAFTIIAGLNNLIVKFFR